MAPHRLGWALGVALLASCPGNEDTEESGTTGDSGDTAKVEVVSVGTALLYGLESLEVEPGCVLDLGDGSLGTGGTGVISGSEVVGDVWAGGDLVLDEGTAVTGLAAAKGTVSLRDGSSASDGATSAARGLPAPVFSEVDSTPGTEGVSVVADEIRTLDPGAYLDVEVAAGGTLRLAGGRYDVDDLTIAGALIAEAEVVVAVAGGLAFGEDADVWRVDRSADLLVSVDGDDPVVVGSGASFEGQLHAPEAMVTASADALLVGEVYAKHLRLLWEVSYDHQCLEQDEICDDGVDQDCTDADLDCDDADLDDDGHSVNEGDCDDDEPTVYPGAAELCDGQLNDCESALPGDETDDDGDGFVECELDPGGWDGEEDKQGDDCDDGDETVYPGAPELCDGQDDDCDDTVPDIETDDDGDGFVECTLDADGWDATPAKLGDDCDDDDGTVYPSSPELCDGLVNACGSTLPADEIDDDGDGYVECTLDAGGWRTTPVKLGDDCLDTDDTVYPGALDVCDGQVNGCVGSLERWETDDDGDGFVECSLDAGGWDGAEAKQGDDCKDSDDTVYPGAVELCDGQVNECGEALAASEVDDDGDGYVECTLDAGGWDGGGTKQGDDCDDVEATIYPGAAELCDGLVNRCGSTLPVDEVDDDGDGYVECTVDGGGWDTSPAKLGDDCLDTEPTVYPGASELCDGQVNACGGTLRKREIDDDGDGYVECTLDAGGWDGAGTKLGDDCDDKEDTVYPGATERCDGQVNACGDTLAGDEVDDDGDGYVECDVDDGGWDGTPSKQGGDCDDVEATIHPSAPELCDGLVNACGTSLPDTEVDDDGDGFVECTVDSGGWDGTPAKLGDDCLDSEATVYPGATELCDGQVNACGGTLRKREIDDDGDGYVECTLDAGGWDGAVAKLGDDCKDRDDTVYPGAVELCDGQVNACGSPLPDTEIDDDDDGYVECTVDGDGWDASPSKLGDDCDDDEDTVYPSATELCDGQINPCGGTLPATEVDDDGDGYVECTLDLDGWDATPAKLGDDCDDVEDTVHPDAEELCNGLDEDCDEVPDDGLTHCAEGEPTPPDPVELATDLDATGVTPFSEGVSFLYEGEDAIQTGVEDGTIDPLRASVLRGTVLDETGTGLPHVEVTVLGAAEYGSTTTRVDGAWDLAVNGGVDVVVSFSKDGYLDVQRQVHPQPKSYSQLPDVVMIGLDPVFTEVVLDETTEMQVAQSSVVIDEWGARQATVMLPAGVEATMTLPDGTEEAVTSAALRVTEYTVGEAGPLAMPGELPPTSAYTYAAEFSLDEALDADATEVAFSEAVVTYLDNFLTFPTGSVVPMGHYDAEVGLWVPGEDGLVIELLSVDGGVATLDIDGSGVEAAPAELEALGISDDELEQLALLFAPGDSFWRVAVPHFSPHDPNFPYGLEDPDNSPRPDTTAPRRGPSEGHETCCHVPAVGPEDRAVTEQVPLTGMCTALVHSSERVFSSSENAFLRFAVTPSEVPETLERVDVTISVAGVTHHLELDALPDQVVDFEWDRLDAYGRAVQGTATARVLVEYAYPAVYVAPGAFFRTFGLYGDATDVLYDGSREQFKLGQRLAMQVGGWDQSTDKMGGWGLSVHHHFDPSSRVLYLGDGTTRSSDGVGEIVQIVAGNGEYDFSGDGGPAVDAALRNPSGLAIDPEGRIYIADKDNGRIRLVDLDGTITTVAGGGADYTTTGIPATDAGLAKPMGLALDADGDLYIAEESKCRVRRVDAAGIIHAVAGTGTCGYSGDGGPAADAQLHYVSDVALDSAGNLYIADTGLSHLVGPGRRIRRVDPTGTIETVVGNGSKWSGGYNGDGEPAWEGRLNEPAGVAIDADGNTYVADASGGTVRRVGVDGIIRTFAGDVYADHNVIGDGYAATEVDLYSTTDLVIDRDGTVFLTDPSHRRIRRISTDGTIVTHAGDGGDVLEGDGGLATASSISTPLALALGPGDPPSLYFATTYHVARIQFPQPTYEGAAYVFTAEDGTEVYQFDADGRHLATTHPLTDSVIWEFTYDEGLLVEVIDRYGAVVTIHRDGAGHATGIESPDGHLTLLGMDANGFLSTIEDPYGAVTTVVHDAGGLLVELSDPEGGASEYAYGSTGLLESATTPDGGTWSLVGTEDTSGREVILQTDLGTTTTYTTEYGADDSATRTTTLPGGATIVSEERLDGSTVLTRADGMVVETEWGPDPRFSMLTPLQSAITTTTPGGLVHALTASREVELSVPGDPSTMTSQTDTLTVNGRTTTVEYDVATATRTTTSPEGRVHAVTLSPAGQPLTVQRGDLEPVANAYDTRGHHVSRTVGTRTTTFGWSEDGWLDTVTDPLDRVTTTLRDDAGRVTTRILPDDREVGMDYDLAGRLIEVVSPGGQVHATTWDEAGQLESYVPPSAGISTPETLFVWDLDHRLDEIIRPDGLVVDHDYDVAGRLSSQILPTCTLDFTWDDATDQLVGISSTTGPDVALEWDGPLLVSETWSGEVVGSVERTWGDDLWVEAETVNGGDEVVFVRDDDGLVITAADLDVVRDPHTGQPIEATLGSLSETWTWDEYGDLESLTVTYGATVLYDLLLTRDGLGRVELVDEEVGGVLTTWEYAWDDAGRLVDVDLDGVDYRAYTWDDDDNRLVVSDGSGPIATATYDDQDRLEDVDGVVYAYTDAGELVSIVDGSDTTDLEIDALGNLLGVSLPSGTEVSYLVDGRGRRVGRQVDGVLDRAWLYGQARGPVVELDETGAVRTRFVYATRQDVPDALFRDGRTALVVADHTGSVRLVVDADTGEVLQRVDYGPWGEVLSDTAPGYQPFGFAGGLHDPDTGLVRMGARDYDPVTGRFISKDPLLLAGGTWNLYAYANGDPVNWGDPTGTSSNEFFATEGDQPVSPCGALPTTSLPLPSLTTGASTGQSDALGGATNQFSLVAPMRSLFQIRPQPDERGDTGDRSPPTSLPLPSHSEELCVDAPQTSLPIF